MKVPINYLCTCICKPLAPTSLWPSGLTSSRWLWRLSSISWRCALFQEVSQSDWNETQDAIEASVTLEKNKVFLDLHDLSSAHTDSHLCDFLKIYFLDEWVKVIKKIDNHLTNLCKLPIPKAGCLLERLTLSTTRSPQGPVAFEEPLCISLMSGLLPEPPPATIKQLLTCYLSSHGPNRNSKTFCSRKKKK